LNLDWSRLTAWPFLLGLSVLLLNDHVLKYQWPSAMTGKLSDFAGLFVVAFLLAGHRPSGWRLLGLVGLVPAFIWWKSPSSEPAIRAWNDSAPFPIYRTVDLSDGIALLILPFAVWAAANARPVLRHRVAGWVILACAWVGIIATSPGPPVKVSAEPLTVQYPLSISKAELLADLQLRGEISSDAAARSAGAGIESFRVRARLSCGRRGGLEAELDIGETSGRAVVSPRKIKMDYSCVESSERNAVLAKFREYFIERYSTAAGL
jgi:hypothetical protein